MCKECGMTKCPSGCPNVGDPEVIAVCTECGLELHAGDEAFRIGGAVYCDACVFEGRITIE